VKFVVVIFLKHFAMQMQKNQSIENALFVDLFLLCFKE
jgi:hypothetical protein